MDEALEEEFYMRRLDAGLFTLQLIDCIIMEVCCSGVTSVMNTIITDVFVIPFVPLQSITKEKKRDSGTDLLHNEWYHASPTASIALYLEYMTEM